MLRWLLIAAFTCLAASAQGQTPLADLPLGDAAAFEADTHIIVTARLPAGATDLDYAEGLAASNDMAVAAIWPLKALDVICFVFSVDGDVDGRIAALADIDAVIDVYAIKSFETLVDMRYRDQYVQIQDALHQMRILPLHHRNTGAGVAIALIDTAIAASHRDLAEQQVIARNFVARAPLDVAERHGTAMAALIVADADNGEGMVGVAPGANLMALRACWEPTPNGKGLCNTFSLARALNFAILNEADVINFSLTGPHDPILNKLIAAALRRNISVVMAAPEEPETALGGAVPGVVFASATPASGMVPAPGLEVLSAMPMDDYDFYSGASVAAAHITGALALLRAANPGASAGELGATLAIASSYGRRIVNMCEAMDLLDSQPMSCLE